MLFDLLQLDAETMTATASRHDGTVRQPPL